MAELQAHCGSKNLKKRHEEQFARRFEGKVREQYAKQNVIAEMFALAEWKDNWARILHRCHINNWLFRIVDIEKNLVTQNSGVLVMETLLVLVTCAGMGWLKERCHYNSLDKKKSFCSSVTGMMCLLPVQAEAEDRIRISLGLLISIVLGTGMRMNPIFLWHRQN